MGNTRRLVNRYLVLACILYIVFPEVTYAARKQPVVRPASATDEFKKGGVTLDIDRHWGEVVDVGPQKVDLPVTQKNGYSWARAKNILKGAINSNPVKYAATAGLTYLIYQLPGASYDPVTGELVKSPDVVKTGSYWSATLYNAPPGYQGKKAFSALDSCKLLYATGMTATQTSSNRYECYRNGSSVGWTSSANFNCPNGIASDFSCSPQPLPPQPFTPSDYDSLVSGMPDIPAGDLDTLGAELLKDFPASFDGPDTDSFTGPGFYAGQPVTTTSSKTNPDGSTTVDLSETTTQYNFDYSTNPLSITTTTTTTTNNYQNGTHTGTTTVTDASPNPVETPKPEKPANEKIDCELMPTHCDWIEWTKEEKAMPDKIPLPTHEVNQPSSVTVSVNAACPAPVVIDGNGIEGWTTFSIEFDVACDFLSSISPIVKGVCMMIAALILVWKP